MLGQLSNYLKNFNKVVNYVSPYVNVVGNLLSSLNTARNVYVNLSKLDDPRETQKDKAVHTAKALSSLAGLIQYPIINPVATEVVEAASYLTDLQEGRRDAPPKPADINSRTNPIENKIKLYSCQTILGMGRDILIRIYFKTQSKTFSKEILNSILI
jgi:hypothetical protein